MQVTSQVYSDSCLKGWWTERERQDVTFKVGEIIAWFYADRNDPTKWKTDEAEERVVGEMEASD